MSQARYTTSRGEISIDEIGVLFEIRGAGTYVLVIVVFKTRRDFSFYRDTHTQREKEKEREKDKGGTKNHWRIVIIFHVPYSLSQVELNHGSPCRSRAVL